MIEQSCVIDTGWAAEQARRVTDRLNRCRAPQPALRPVVFWSDRVVAFTTIGPYVFISRELQQRLAHDAAVAFVLAHEMAHHDLGHLRGAFRDADAPRLTVARDLLSLARGWLEHPENEAAADARALELCVQAGYGPSDCLDALRILEAHALDCRDLDGVFGPEDGSPPGGEAKRVRRRRRRRRWWWQRRRGYYSLDERRRRLQDQAAALQAALAPASTAPASTASRAVEVKPLCPACGETLVETTGQRCACCERQHRLNSEFERLYTDASRGQRWRIVAIVATLVVLLIVGMFLAEPDKPQPEERERPALSEKHPPRPPAARW